MKIYFKVEDGQFVGADKFQDGNNAVEIDFLNEVKTYVPSVRKVNFKTETLQESLKEIKKLLHQRFKGIPRYPFSNPEVKLEITNRLRGIGNTEKEIQDFWMILETNKIDSVDKIFRSDKRKNWQDCTATDINNPHERFKCMMSALIKLFERRME
jgi:hypothetical protein